MNAMVSFIHTIISFSTPDLYKALEIFWKGMLAIAIVLVIIFVTTLIMNRISAAAQKRKENTNPQPPDDPNTPQA